MTVRADCEGGFRRKLKERWAVEMRGAVAAVVSHCGGLEPFPGSWERRRFRRANADSSSVWRIMRIGDYLLRLDRGCTLSIRPCGADERCRLAFPQGSSGLTPGAGVLVEADLRLRNAHKTRLAELRSGGRSLDCATAGRLGASQAGFGVPSGARSLYVRFPRMKSRAPQARRGTSS